jgi:hypothetical protein
LYDNIADLPQAPHQAADSRTWNLLPVTSAPRPVSRTTATI